ncbi:His-rich protein BRANT [Bradyrhizobium lablabi]|uniref:His-rich protein BRANT n=1 Tax=Bradyrhizobium lablabi TaxID=722472 RepID=UPI001BADE9C6|nr:hypothetical protein [Bradyrhizobium lablabi]MBR0692782.1 hypothetical protein [Bradyrhizobium lablabi]
MLKTISAALLAVSVIAAPAFAAGYGQTTTRAPVIKSERAASKLLNANAKMGHHHKHYRHHHHTHMGMLKLKGTPKHASRHLTPKVAVKHVAPFKRG